MSPSPQLDPLAGLLDKIIEQPDQDEPRLRYALACEKRSAADQIRAKFIRLQLQLSALPTGIDHPEWFRFASQADELLLQHAPEWTPPWFQTDKITDVEFRRGFIEAVTVPFLAPYTWPKLFAAAPIRQLRIVNLDGDADLGRLLPILAQQNLTALYLDAQNLTDTAIFSILDYGFPHLTTLSLAYNNLTNRGVSALAEASHPTGPLPNLRTVNLQGNPFDPIEQLYEDQGILVSRHIPTGAADLPQAPWLLQSRQ